MTDPKETWKTIEGFSSYRISSYGRIFRMGRFQLKKIPKQGKKLIYVKGSLVAQHKNKNTRYGYYRVTLWNDSGERVRRYVHRLVAEAHCPDYCDSLEVDHRGTKEQNWAHKLECVTRQENMKRCHTNNPHIIENLTRKVA